MMYRLLAIAISMMAGVPATGLAASAMPHKTLDEIFPRSPAPPSQHAAPDTTAPVTIEADAMGYDKDAQIVVATGHVVVLQGDYLLNADKLTYFQQTDRVEATGHVSVLQPSGDVYFADQAELTDGVKKGVVQTFRARLSDNSALAAQHARKLNSAVTVMDKAVYSPCKLCDDLAPFWQIKASSMKVDEADERMTFHNAQLEMFGIPTLYAPYLQGPTPNAEAQSGILAPTYSSGGNLGTQIRIPYYWRIASDKDVTLTPWIFANDNPLLQGDYRQLTDHGNYSVKFTATDPEKRDSGGRPVGGHEFRGNLDALGAEQVADYAWVGFDINRVSDETYLRRYALDGGQDSVLFSRVYAESAVQRNMASIEALGIQGLRTTDSPKTTPQIAPILNGYYETTPDANGLRFHVGGNAQSLMRDEGTNQRRVSVNTGASYPTVTDNGQVVNTSVNLRQDLYDEDNVAVSSTQSFSGTKARTIPQGAVQWRYPLVRGDGGGSMTIEPIALAVAQPTGSNSAAIANEDSKQMELNDTNVFDIDRTPGYDSIDTGGRLAYGVRSEYLFRGGQSVEGLLGQTYSLDDQTPFPNSAKAGTNASDIIGRLGVAIAPWNISYRFALEQQTMTLNRSSVTAAFDKPWLNWSIAYNAIKNNRYVANSEEISSSASVPLTEQWKIYSSATRDLQLDHMTEIGGGLIFHNECFDFTLDGTHNYTQDQDVQSSTSVTFRVGFKNLGVFGG